MRKAKGAFKAIEIAQLEDGSYVFQLKPSYTPPSGGAMLMPTDTTSANLSFAPKVKIMMNPTPTARPAITGRRIPAFSSDNGASTS